MRSKLTFSLSIKSIRRAIGLSLLALSLSISWWICVSILRYRELRRLRALDSYVVFLEDGPAVWSPMMRELVSITFNRELIVEIKDGKHLRDIGRLKIERLKLNGIIVHEGRIDLDDVKWLFGIKSLQSIHFLERTLITWQAAEAVLGCKSLRQLWLVGNVEEMSILRDNVIRSNMLVLALRGATIDQWHDRVHLTNLEELIVSSECPSRHSLEQVADSSRNLRHIYFHLSNQCDYEMFNFGERYPLIRVSLIPIKTFEKTGAREQAEGAGADKCN